MKRGVPKTYRSKRPLKIALTVLISLIVSVLILAVVLFFVLRQYIVYEPDGGLHLDIPWLSDTTTPN